MNSWASRPIALAIALAFAACPAEAAARSRDRVQDRVASRICRDMAREVTVPPGGARIDCVSATHAIEIDFSNRWAEAAGQSLHAAQGLGRVAGVVMLCHASGRSRCRRQFELLRGLFFALRARATIWYCPLDADQLRQCERVEVRR